MEKSTFAILEFCILPIQQQKNSVECEIFAIAYAIEILHRENLPFDVTLMRDHLLVCLQLEIFSPFPGINKRFYRCRSILLFSDMYCIFREAYFLDYSKSNDG